MTNHHISITTQLPNTKRQSSNVRVLEGGMGSLFGACLPPCRTGWADPPRAWSKGAEKLVIGSFLASVLVASVAAAGTADIAAAAQPDAGKPQESRDSSAPPGDYLATLSSSAASLANPHQGLAGEMFGAPVSVGNYYFAKRVAFMFPQPWGAADLPEKDREPFIWEQLLLHYQAFQRRIEATDDELETMVNELLASQQQSFTRRQDPAAYRRWVTSALQEEPELLENQVRYLIQIRKMKETLLQEQRVTVTDEEAQQLYLDERHHVGGEMVTFETKELAQAFYERVKEPARWEAMKANAEQKVRPVSLMTLEAYMDLWGIPREQMVAFHALPIGAVGAPMPFGKQWCVYRLLDKRIGDLKEFPTEQSVFRQRVAMRKKAHGLTRVIEQLKQSANLKVFLPPQ